MSDHRVAASSSPPVVDHATGAEKPTTGHPDPVLSGASELRRVRLHLESALAEHVSGAVPLRRQFLADLEDRLDALQSRGVDAVTWTATEDTLAWIEQLQRALSRAAANAPRSRT